MKILIFTEGTILMHKNAAGHTPEKIIEQVKHNEPSVHEYSTYIPIGNAAQKIRQWQNQGVTILYVTSRTEPKQITKIQKVLMRYGFPKGELVHRETGEEYHHVAEHIMPDILIEDDCESIGGEDEMTITHVSTKTKEKIMSISVREFRGIDDLPDDIHKLISPLKD